MFIACLAASHFNFTNTAQIDCEPAPYVAWSLVTKGNFDLRAYRDLDALPQNVFRVLPDGTRLSRYPPGSALAAVPVVAVPAMILGEPPSHRWMLRFGKLTGSLCLAAAAVMFLSMVRRVAPAAAWPATILFAFGTCLFSVAGQGLWQHGPAAMWITAGMWLLLGEGSGVRGQGSAADRVAGAERSDALCAAGSMPSDAPADADRPAGASLGVPAANDPDRSRSAPATRASLASPRSSLTPEPWPLTTLAAGVCLGLAVMTRPSSAIFALAAGVALLISRQWRAAIAAAAGGAVPVGLLVLYHFVHYGDPAGGYSDEVDSWHTPISLGLPGLLFAPSRGLLVYSPALLLVPLGVWAAVRMPASPRRTLILAFAAAAGATVLLYARWYMWWGGWCFGPRFIIEALPAFCLLFALAFDRLRRPAARAAAWVLVGLSVFVHFLGAYGNDDAWHARHDRSDDGLSLFEWRDTQIEAHLRKLLRLPP